jgi:hypothetical protein
MATDYDNAAAALEPPAFHVTDGTTHHAARTITVPVPISVTVMPLFMAHATISVAITVTSVEVLSKGRGGRHQSQQTGKQ